MSVLCEDGLSFYYGIWTVGGGPRGCGIFASGGNQPPSSLEVDKLVPSQSVRKSLSFGYNGQSLRVEKHEGCE